MQWPRRSAGAAWVDVPLEALAGGGGATHVVPVYNLDAAQACLDACGAQAARGGAAAAWLRVRLTGVGRGGVVNLGDLKVGLGDLARPPQPQQGGPAMRELPPPRDSADAGGAAEARVGLVCRALPSPSVGRRTTGPPPQRAEDPQMCVEMHTLRLAAAPLATALAAAPAPPVAEVTAAELQPRGRRAAAATVGVAGSEGPLGEARSLWVSLELPGVDEAICSTRLRLSDFATRLATPAADPAPPTAPAAALPAAATAEETSANEILARLAGASAPPAAAAAPPDEPGGPAAPGAEWSGAQPLHTVELIELYGSGRKAFDALAKLVQPPHAASPASAPEAAVAAAAAAAGGGPIPGQVGLELMAASRKGVRRLARASLSLATVVASGGDLVHAAVRLHAWDGAAWRGAPLCEVVLSLGMQAALRAMAHGAHVAPVAPQLTGPGAAIAIGAAECTLQLSAVRAARCTRVWLEVDARRAAGVLLRSAAQAVGPARVDFGLKELLFVADGSAPQQRLAQLLLTPAHAHLTFSIYGDTPVEVDADADADADAEAGGGSVCLCEARVDLRAILASRRELLLEPLELRDAEGTPRALLRVSVLACEALARAWRSLRQASRRLTTLELGANSLVLRGGGALGAGLRVVWVEASVVAGGEPSEPLASRRHAVGEAVREEGGVLPLELRGPAMLRHGGAAHTALLQEGAEGAAPAVARFVLLGSTHAVDVGVGGSGVAARGTPAGAHDGRQHLAHADLPLSRLQMERRPLPSSR